MNTKVLPIKSEGRGPKAERNPKAEGRTPNADAQPGGTDFSTGLLSVFGRRTSAFFRPSTFGLRSSALRAAFSLIEIMVTVGLLTFIILGLLLMFNQTQRAFRAGLTQSDVLEAGRATMDLVGRELEQMSPSEYPDNVIGGVRYRATNFFVEPSPGFDWKNPLVQELPGNDPSRTNLIQRFYFLSKLNQDWMATGYEVVPDDANGCVGTLYRYSATNYPRGGMLLMSGQFPQVPATNMNRIADGIVHLRLRAFANNGYLITTNLFNRTNASYPLRQLGPYTNIPNAVLYNSSAYNSDADMRQASCYFMSNALPGYLELELGVLEPRVLQKYRSIGVPLAARAYLSNQVAHVHIFRQRIPVRNVDLSVYP